MSDDNKRDDQTTQGENPAAAAADFKRAASQLLHDRFGIPLNEGGEVDMSKVDLQALQEQAPNLIVNLMDAFTQKLKASLEGGAAAGGEGGEVIDLEARKAAAQPSVSASSILPPELQAKLGGSIKQAFNNYVEQNVQARTPEGGIDVNVDLDFIRQHGKPMISSVLRSVAETLLPKGEVDIPTALKNAFAPAKPAEAAPAEGGEAAAGEDKPAEAAAAEGGKPGVSVKLNFSHILRSLFAQKGQGAPAAPADGDKPSE